MEIGSVKVVNVKQEYMDSMVGQNKLVNIINGNVNCEDMIQYGVNDYVISELFLEDYYIKDYWNDKEYTKERAIHALLFGVSDFNYTYSAWETELGIKNPTKEEIAERVVQMWGIDPEDKEEIEMIANSFTNHDNIALTYMSLENIEKVIADLENSDLLGICKSIEAELNSKGISFDEISENDIQFINSIKEFFKEALRKDSKGIVYVLSDTCDFCEED